MQKVRRHPDVAVEAPTACKLMVSGTISLPSPGYFSAFPHGTSPLSVGREYLALACGQARFLRGFPCPVVLGIYPRKSYLFRLQGFHLLWLPFPRYSTKDRIGNFPKKLCLLPDKSRNPLITTGIAFYIIRV